jgi:probable HAF family extracellular repeat protein
MTLASFRAAECSSKASRVAGAALAAGLLAVTSASATRAEPACSPSTTILESPRPSSLDVQAKAINDRGDVVGFADSRNGKSPTHAILWKGGKVAAAVDLGVLPGYVASEAYGMNDDRAVFGLLYDSTQRPVPFRWADGRMTVLRAPNGRPGYTDNPGAGGRNAINSRGVTTWTIVVGVDRRAVRWTPAGEATFLPGLPGHTWTGASSINGDGVVSGWSRSVSALDGEESPVLWDASGTVIRLKTTPGHANGIAEATNRSGVTVGLLGRGDLGADETDAVVWQSRSAEPLLLGRPAPHVAVELADVNDRGEAVGTSGAVAKDHFVLAQPRIWRTGWTSLKPIGIPPELKKSPVVSTALNDINNRGEIVGTVYGLARNNVASVRRVDPVLWTCQFGP